jgi:hypothetical protein
MKKVVEVEPFTPTYRAYNKVTGEYHGEFVRLIDAIHFVEAKFQPAYYEQSLLSFTLRLEPEIKIVRVVRGSGWWDETTKRVRYTKDVKYVDPSQWVIVDELGIVNEGRVKLERVTYRRERDQRWEDYTRKRNATDARMVRAKGSTNKVKASCVRVADTSDLEGYSTPQRNYFRRPQTTNEHRWNLAHSEEYGPGIVRGRRSGKNLVDAWDDRPVSIWDTERSWKHHSKRRKQWKPK